MSNSIPSTPRRHSQSETDTETSSLVSSLSASEQSSASEDESENSAQTPVMKTRRTSDGAPATPATHNANRSAPPQAVMTSSSPTLNNRPNAEERRARYRKTDHLNATQHDTNTKIIKTIKRGGAEETQQAPEPDRSWEKFSEAVTAEGYLLLQELSESDLRELAAWLRTSPAALRALNIFDSVINEATGAALADALRVNTTLTMLQLSYNKIDSDGAALLAGALKANKTLTTFNLIVNFIGDAGAAAFADALRFNTTLTQLCLSANGIEDAGMAAIASSLLVNTTLTSLIVENNTFGIDAAAALADVLKENTTLTKLCLSSNNIADVDVIGFADALKFNKTLTELHIRSEFISDRGAMAFADTLKFNNTLAMLDLRTNQFGDATVVALADALKFNKTLVTLNLGQNNFGDEAAVMLSDALKHNSTLIELNLEFTKISAAGALALVEALEHNENLTTLAWNFTSNRNLDLDKKLNEQLQKNRNLKLKPYGEASLDLIFKHSPILREVGMPTDVIPVLAQQLSSEVLATFEREWIDAFRAPPSPVTATTTDLMSPAALVTLPAALATDTTSSPPVITEPIASAAEINALLAEPNPVAALSRWIDGHANSTAAINWVDPANGYTLLHYAVVAQQGAVVRSLLMRGIDPTRADQNNQTAAQLAQRRAESSSSQTVSAIAALFK